MAEEIQKIVDKAFLIQENLVQRQEAEKGARSLMERFGRIDILVNVFGGSKDALIKEMSGETWNEIMNLSVKTCLHCVRAAVPSMMRRKYGRIINISSLRNLSACGLRHRILRRGGSNIHYRKRALCERRITLKMASGLKFQAIGF